MRDKHSLPVLSQRVLPTLNVDGSRRWVRPKPFTGKYERWRRITAYLLMALFAALPFIPVGGKPAILLDVVRREFSLFGATFHATDGVLLMLLLLAIFIAIFWVTALYGRVWCGYGCPQTVYLEFLFRPIERWLEGSRGQQQKLDREGPNARRLIKYAIYAVLALLLGNLFLSYFVGVKQLGSWLSRSPFEHPVPFLVMLATAGLVFFDFTYFREQMCTIVCPYARLQSVLLDERSLIVGYDGARGEPRGSRKQADNGDCIDCKACVVACPTGIDIRDGLQLECVACAQCVDACDGVMAKINKPLGLIRYASQAELERQPKARGFRWRTLVYPALMLPLLVALVVLGRATGEPKVTVLRGTGAPFVVEADGKVQNQIRVKIHNRDDAARRFHIALEGAPGSALIAPENPLLVGADEMATTSVFVQAPRALFSGGRRSVRLVVESDGGFRSVTPYNLLGPR